MKAYALREEWLDVYALNKEQYEGYESEELEIEDKLFEEYNDLYNRVIELNDIIAGLIIKHRCGRKE